VKHKATEQQVDELLTVFLSAQHGRIQSISLQTLGARGKTKEGTPEKNADVNQTLSHIISILIDNLFNDTLMINNTNQ
jgi:hypothetical protein